MQATLYDIHALIITLCHCPDLPDLSLSFGLLPPTGLVMRLDSDIVDMLALNIAKPL